MKCSSCGKEIKNAYHLDGKIYGYNCYKMAVALKYTKMQELKNDEYVRKCMAVIEVFKNKELKDDWNINFQKSILDQWNNCKKLTGKQLNLIIKKFTEIENIDCLLTFYEINRQFDDKQILSCDDYLIRYLNKDTLPYFKNDERLYNYIRNIKSSSIKRGTKYYIIKWVDIDEADNIVTEINKEPYLQDLKNDEYINIIEIIEI